MLVMPRTAFARPMSSVVRAGHARLSMASDRGAGLPGRPAQMHFANSSDTRPPFPPGMPPGGALQGPRPVVLPGPHSFDGAARPPGFDRPFSSWPPIGAFPSAPPDRMPGPPAGPPPAPALTARATGELAQRQHAAPRPARCHTFDDSNTLRTSSQAPSSRPPRSWRRGRCKQPRAGRTASSPARCRPRSRNGQATRRRTRSRRPGRCRRP